MAKRSRLPTAQTKILFSKDGRYPPVGYGGTMLHTINVDGTNPAPLINGFVNGWNEDVPDWSPAANKIVYSVNQWDFNVALFISNPDGTNRQFFDGCGIGFCSGMDLWGPVFSPDGSKIAFSRDDQFNTYSEICVRNTDGSGFSVLTTRTQGENFEPSWQPLSTEVSVSGRVTTPDGRSLRNAVVTITDSVGVARAATTGSFGIFSFDSVRRGETYLIGVSSKRYRFTPRIIKVDGNLSNIDLVGLE
jgi:Tol biopolymer transport system component